MCRLVLLDGLCRVAEQAFGNAEWLVWCTGARAGGSWFWRNGLPVSCLLCVPVFVFLSLRIVSVVKNARFAILVLTLREFRLLYFAWHSGGFARVWRNLSLACIMPFWEPAYSVCRHSRGAVFVSRDGKLLYAGSGWGRCRPSLLPPSDIAPWYIAS